MVTTYLGAETLELPRPYSLEILAPFPRFKTGKYLITLSLAAPSSVNWKSAARQTSPLYEPASLTSY